MSTDSVTFTDFSARLKNHAIVIEAFGPDDISAKVTIEPDEIWVFYQMTPFAFVSAYGEDAEILAEIFTAIKGIKVSETIN